MLRDNVTTQLLVQHTVVVKKAYRQVVHQLSLYVLLPWCMSGIQLPCLQCLRCMSKPICKEPSKCVLWADGKGQPCSAAL